MSSAPSGRAFSDCSLPFDGGVARLTNGRALAFDAPVLPTSKAQCKNGGWRNFPQFKNQGQCVAAFPRQMRRGASPSPCSSPVHRTS